jgi:NAD(P)-dependent dehydrogenase (short-subunit alcohol dehydrogenase family)
MSIDRALEGHVAVVTGGGKGIGRAIALDLSGRGVRLILTGRDERALGETVGEIAHGGGQARHIVGDVRDEKHVRAAVGRALETWGRLDAAIANAGQTGAFHLGQGASAGFARVREIVDTNLLGTLHLFDAAVAAMEGTGRLVAISSVLGKFGVPGQAAYCASKAGVHGLVRAVAVEVGPRGITCNAVCPGWVETEMARVRIGEIAADAAETYEQAARHVRAAIPMGRFVDADEVARLVGFLCGPAAAAITGQAISVCGGATPFAG